VVANTSLSANVFAEPVFGEDERLVTRHRCFTANRMDAPSDTFVETRSNPTSLWRAEFRAMLGLAWPLILSNLTMTLIAATDVVLLGRLGARELAAAALGLNLNMALTIFSLGFVYAAAPLMASEIGRKSNSVRDVRRTFRQSAWAVLSIVIPMSVLLWHTEDVLLLFGQDPVLAEGAGHFIHGYQWSMLPFLMFYLMRSFLAALERPRWALGVSAVGIGLNAIVCWALIFGKLGLPALGLFGAGLGSSIVWTIIALALAAVILTDKQFRRYHLFGGFWRTDWPRYKEIWRLGLPIAMMYGFEASVFAAAVWLMGLINAESVAAHTIALQIASMTFMVPMGMAQAATVRVGIGYGRKDAAAIHRSGWMAFILGVGFMAVMALTLLVFPEQLMGIFIDRDLAVNARVIELGVSFLMVAAVFQIVDGAQVVGAGMLRGLQDTLVPMVMAGIGYWGIGIGVGSFLAFRLGWDGLGIWIGLAVGLAIVSVLLVTRWLARARLGLLPN
jgi:multidrug resistance protein, MATE family